MAEEIRALFKAQETISSALRTASDAMESFDRDLSDLSASMANASLNSQGAEQEFEEFANTLHEVSTSTSILDENLDEAQKAMIRYSLAGSDSEEESENLRDAMMALNSSASVADENIDELRQSFDLLRTSGSLTGEQLGNLQTKVTNLSATTSGGTDVVESLNRALLAQFGAAKKAEDAVSQHASSMAGLVGPTIAATRATNSASESTQDYSQALSSATGSAIAAMAPQETLAMSVDSVGDEMDETRNSAITLSAALGALSTAAQGSALEFGSLSVNIGPFNLALRNFLTQVPAILTGMGSILAIVGSLIVAFTTLAAVTGALVVGGAIAFFEDFSQQFEEAGEAAEALGAALRDLFTAAIEPIMTEANMDLFINSMNAAAGIVNRFAQFVQQMRSEVLSAVGEMGGDIDDFFNAMRNSFIALEPVIIGLVNFILRDLPKVMETFASLTTRLSTDLSILIGAFGGLMGQLLEFASTVLTGLTPAIFVAVEVLLIAFGIINLFPKALTSMAIAFVVAALAAAKLTLSVVNLAGAVTGLTSTMATQAGTGSLLGVVYTQLTMAARAYTTSELSLLAVTKAATAAIWGEIKAIVFDTGAKIKNSLAAKVLATAKAGLLSSIFAVTAAIIGESAATSLATVVMGAYATVTSAAATATGFLVGTLASLSTPVLVLLALVPFLIGLLAELAGFDVVGGISNFFSTIIGWIKDTISAMKDLLGLGGGDARDNMPGVADPDSIQTDSNVDLSFEDSVENNVDVQADPEEKAQLSRVTKDAIEEANSLARRRQGTQ